MFFNFVRGFQSAHELCWIVFGSSAWCLLGLQIYVGSFETSKHGEMAGGFSQGR
jgi:hypothetical protein